MPLTLDQKRKLIAAHGLSPDEYDIDDTEQNIIPVPFKQPDPSGTPVTTTDLPKTPPSTGMLESAGRGAVESFGPGAVGLGATIGALALAPEPTGITKIAALLLGLGASIAASKAQRAIVPTGVQEKLFTRPEDYQQNPVSTILGGFVGPGAFRPSLKDVPDLIGGIKALPRALSTGASISAPQSGALFNAAANTIPSAGMYGADVLSGNREFNLKELAAEVLPGLLMTRTTPIGRLLGLKDAPSTREILDSQRMTEATSTVPDTKTSTRIAGMLPEESTSTLEERYAQEARMKEEDVVPKGRAQMRAEVEQQKLVEAEQQSEANRQKALKDSGYRRMEAEVEIENQKAIAAEQEAARLKAENEQRKVDLSIGGKRGYGEELSPAERLKAKMEAARLGEEEVVPEVNVGRDLNQAKRTKRLQTELEQPLNEGEQIQDEYDRGVRYSKKSDLPPLDSTPIEGLPPESRRKIKSEIERIARLRRQRVTYVEGLKDPKTGAEVLGQYDATTRSFKLNKALYAGDTAPHETAHGRILDLLESSNKSDSSLVLKGLEFADAKGRKFNTPEDFKRLPVDEQIEIEERFTKNVGPEGYRRQRQELFGKKRERFGEWLKQIGNHFKVKTGSAGSDELYQHFVERQMFDAPDNLREGMGKFGGVKGVEKREEKRQSSESDLPSGSQKRDVVKSYLADNLDFIIKDVDKQWEEANEPKAFRLAEGEKLKSTLGSYIRSIALDEHPMAGDMALQFIKPFVKDKVFLRVKDVIESGRKFLGLENMPFDENKASQMAEERRRSQMEAKYDKRYSKESDLPPSPKYAEVMKGMQNQLEVSSFEAAKKVEKIKPTALKDTNKDYKEYRDQQESFVENLFKEEGKEIDPAFKNRIIDSYLDHDDPNPSEVFDYVEKSIGLKKAEILLEGLTDTRVINQAKGLTPSLIELENAREGSRKKTEELEAFTRRDVERNSTESDLPPKQTDSPEFKNWFGDSKVVDAEGKPLVVYHGSGNDIKQFKGRMGEHGWFTEDAKKAGRYADGLEGANITPVYLNIKNPAPAKIANYKSVKQMKELGYDGVIFTYEKSKGGKTKEYYTFSPERIKSAIGNSGAFDPSNPDIRFSKESDLPSPEDDYHKDPNYPSAGSLGRLFSSATKQIRNLGGKTASHVSDQSEKYFALKSLNEGLYSNSIQAEITSYPKEARERVDEYGREMMRSRGKEKPFDLTDEEQSLYDSVRAYLGKVADDNTQREIKQNPNYWPAILDTKVANIWNKAPNSPEGRQYQRLWMNHAQEQVDSGRATYTRDELDQILDDYMAAVSSSGREASLTFGALRKAAGLGLPIEMQDNNLLSRFGRYGNRVAKDLAFSEAVESDPTMRYMFRLKDDKGVISRDIPTLPDGTQADPTIRGSKPLQDIQKFMYDEFQNVNHPRIQAASRVINSSLLGTATGIRDFITSPLNVSTVIGARNSRALIEGFNDWKKGMEDSYKYGARKMKMNELEFGSAASPDTLTRWFNEVADGFRKYSGREAAEQASRIYMWNVGKISAFAEFGRAANGEAKSVEWLKKHGTTVKDLDKYIGLSGAEIPEDVLNRISKSVVDRAAGTYDARGLPTGVMEGPLAPFFSLSRWSIEKANTIVEDVIAPARKGDFTPLLSYTLGSLLTGAAIQQLNQLMSSGKKGSEPTLGEASAADEQQVRAVVNLLQLGSFGGIIGEMMKTSTELYSGHAPRGLSFPLADFVSDNLQRNLTDYFGAIQAGEDKFEASLGLIENVMTQSIQTLRLVSYWTWNKDGIERKNAYRDYRLWQELTNRRAPEGEIARPNELIGKPEKEFKRARSVEEAAVALPKAIDNIIKKAGKNPMEVVKGFQNLKRNSYQTWPTEPWEQMAYYEYLKKVEGEKAASESFVDFLKQREVNKFKNEQMVPTL